MEDIVLQRLIEAPCERVFKAFTDAQDLMAWHHATEGWTTPFAEADLRVDGTYKIGFRSPDGTQDFTLEGTYREIIPSEKLVYTIGTDRMATVMLMKQEGKTLLIWSFTPETTNPREMQKQGWAGLVDNLVAYLKTT